MAALASQSVSREEIPEEFVCPITLDVMSDPVIALTEDASNSHTYERSAIEQVGGVGAQCPLTRQRITSLVPNRALKETIATWRSKTTHSESGQKRSAPEEEGAAASSSVAFKRPMALRVDRNTEAEANLPVAHGVPVQVDGETVNQWQIPYRGGVLFVEIFAYDDQNMLVRLHTNSMPLPRDVDTNMDASGSMQASCSSKLGESATQWSWFDIAAQLQIAQTLSLGNNDRCTVRKFATSSEVVASERSMTKPNRDRAVERIRATRVGTGAGNRDQTTNLYAAIQSLTLIKKPDLKSRHRLCWIACDGRPNESPCVCREAEFVKNRAKNEGRWVPSVHVFAVGKDANAMLLHHTAKELGGTFWYISDASMAGSAGCTAIANFNTVSVTGVRINGIHVGSLRSGQPRHILVPTSSEIRFVCDQIGNEHAPLVIDEPDKKPMSQAHKAAVSLRMGVLSFIGSMRPTHDPTANEKPATFRWTAQQLGEFTSRVQAHADLAKEHPMGKAILQDVLSPSDLERLGIARDDGREPQVPMAMRDASTLRSWGTPYLLHFAQCLEREMPINDKDTTSNYLSSLNGQFQQAKGRAMTIYADTPLDLNRHKAAEREQVSQCSSE